MATSSLPLLTITPGALASVLVSCWGEYPNVAYGLLAERDGHLLRVLMQATAASARPVACAAELPDDRAPAARSRGGERLDVGASFHAHLDGPAAPTPCDLDRLATRPVRPAIIVGLQDIDAPDIRAWTITGGQPPSCKSSSSARRSSTRPSWRMSRCSTRLACKPGGDPPRRRSSVTRGCGSVTTDHEPLPDMQGHLDAFPGAPGPAR
jgi:proteasome lid subunit RPN8/RPN11